MDLLFHEMGRYGPPVLHATRRWAWPVAAGTVETMFGVVPLAAATLVKNIGEYVVAKPLWYMAKGAYWCVAKPINAIDARMPRPRGDLPLPDMKKFNWGQAGVADRPPWMNWLWNPQAAGGGNFRFLEPTWRWPQVGPGYEEPPDPQFDANDMFRSYDHSRRWWTNFGNWMWEQKLREAEHWRRQLIQTHALDPITRNYTNAAGNDLGVRPAAARAIADATDAQIAAGIVLPAGSVPPALDLTPEAAAALNANAAIAAAGGIPAGRIMGGVAGVVPTGIVLPAADVAAIVAAIPGGLVANPALDASIAMVNAAAAGVRTGVPIPRDAFVDREWGSYLTNYETRNDAFKELIKEASENLNTHFWQQFEAFKQESLKKMTKWVQRKLKLAHLYKETLEFWHGLDKELFYRGGHGFLKWLFDLATGG